MSVKRIVSAGYFSIGKNNHTRVLTRSGRFLVTLRLIHSIQKLSVCVLVGFK